MVELLLERVNLPSFPVLAFLPIILSLFFLYKLSSTINPKKKLPPSPPTLPIIGNLHQVGYSSPHRSLKALSQKYGGLMLLHLGRKPTVVISSKEIASLVLKTFDSSFIGRPEIPVGKHISYNCKDLIFSTYGDHWKSLRSICVFNLLSTKRVKSFRSAREEEVGSLIHRIKKSPSLVNLTNLFFLLSDHVIYKTAFGRVYDGEGGGEAFGDLVCDTVSLLGAQNMETIVPLVGGIINRFNGFNAKLEKLCKRIDDFMGKIIEQHEDGGKPNGEEPVDDFVDILLDIQRNNLTNTMPMDKDIIKGVILDMFVAGTHTSQRALEWTFTELMRNPTVMKRLQDEVRGIAGGKEFVGEEDVEKMGYLKAVVKEGLRLHPPVPLPIPRECIEEVEINGYTVPAGTQIILNVWAIGRDPNYWERPEEFVPERFLDSPLDFKGQHFEFLPFGGGRRGCPGITFAISSIELAIANLVCHFDWSLPDGGERDSIDISESEGAYFHKRTPLIVVATPVEN